MPSCRKVAVGGTFDHFHRGHEVLLSTAFKFGDKVVIGITSDAFLVRLGKADSAPYEERLSRIKMFLRDNGLENRAIIVQLDDPFGPATTDPDIDGIVVSVDTLPRAEDANRIRSQLGMRPMGIHTVPLFLAKDNRPISSTRIRKMEIDTQGNLL
jgi:pantetheine-phosphate adenylyltransferase